MVWAGEVTDNKAADLPLLLSTVIVYILDSEVRPRCLCRCISFNLGLYGSSIIWYYDYENSISVLGSSLQGLRKGFEHLTQQT